MASGQRPLYEDDALVFIPDNNSSSAAIQGTGLSASTFIFVGGSYFTIAIPQTLSATNNSPIFVDFNNANWIDSSVLTSGNAGVRWFVNKLDGRPTMNAAHRQNPINPSFSANWVSLTSIGAGAQYVVVQNTPVRFVRLRGNALSASNFVAYLMTDSVTQGV